MDFFVGDATGLFKHVNTLTKSTVTFKALPQDRKEAIICACWSEGQHKGLGLSESEITVGRRSGRVEAFKVPASFCGASSATDAGISVSGRAAAAVAGTAAAASAAISHSGVLHFAPRHEQQQRNIMSPAVDDNGSTDASNSRLHPPIIRLFQMPAACVQVSPVHAPEDRALLNGCLRDDLLNYDPYFSRFHSFPAVSPLLPLIAPVAVSPDKQLFCIDEEGHCFVLDWQGSFSQSVFCTRSTSSSISSGCNSRTSVNSTSRSSSNSNDHSSIKEGGNDNRKCWESKLPMRRVLIPKSQGAAVATAGIDSSPMPLKSDDSQRQQQPQQNYKQTASSAPINIKSLPPAATASFPIGAKGKVSKRSSDSADLVISAPQTSLSNSAVKVYNENNCNYICKSVGDFGTHKCCVRGAWQLAGPVGCATPVNPLLPDRFAFGGKNNDLKVFDFAREAYVWTAKNVRSTLLLLQVPVQITSVAWLPQVHPFVLAAGTAQGALRLYDMRCQRRPVYEKEFACSSSAWGGETAREPRAVSAMCGEAMIFKDELLNLRSSSKKTCAFGRSNGDDCSSGSCSVKVCDSGTDNSSISTNLRSYDARTHTSTICGNTRSRKRQLCCDSCCSTTGSSNHHEVLRRPTRESGFMGRSCKKKEFSRSIEQAKTCCIIQKSNDKASELFRDAQAVEATANVKTIEMARISAEGKETPVPREVMEKWAFVRSLYGREKTSVYYADNYGAVYRHRVLTGEAFYRWIDPEKKKRNRTSSLAPASSVSSSISSHSCSEEECNKACENREPHAKETVGEQQQKQQRQKATRKRNAEVDDAEASTKESLSDVDAEAHVAVASTTCYRAFGRLTDNSISSSSKKRRNILLRKYKQRQNQKLQVSKNSGRMCETPPHGPQYTTVFEGGYKGAIGAIVALNVDASNSFLVGAGYGRHAYLWSAETRKLLFKVYLKQQLRTLLLRSPRLVLPIQSTKKKLSILYQEKEDKPGQQQYAPHQCEQQKICDAQIEGNVMISTGSIKVRKFSYDSKQKQMLKKGMKN